MSKILACILLVVGIIILVWGLSLFNAWKQKKFQKRKAEYKKIVSDAKKSLAACPICKTPLAPGENIISRVYQPMKVKEQYCSISGCPHCFPICEPGIIRKCPVCDREVPVKGYLVAHLFNYATGKKHVLVTGCSEEAGFKNRDLSHY